MGLSVLTVATDTNRWDFRAFFLASCEWFHILPTVLGAGQRWTGYTMKNLLLAEHLDSLPSEEIVLFVDGYDSIFISGTEEIESKFLAFNHPCVISAEKYCWPDPTVKSQYPDSKTRWRYLNSGGLIGKAGYLKQLLHQRPAHAIAKSHSWSQQAFFTAHFLDNPSSIRIDESCEIFQTMGGTGFSSEVAIRDGRLRNNATGTSPCHLHFNGDTLARLLTLGPHKLVPWSPNFGTELSRLRLLLDDKGFAKRNSRPWLWLNRAWARMLVLLKQAAG